MENRFIPFAPVDFRTEPEPIPRPRENMAGVNMVLAEFVKLKNGIDYTNPVV